MSNLVEEPIKEGQYRWAKKKFEDGSMGRWEVVRVDPSIRFGGAPGIVDMRGREEAEDCYMIGPVIHAPED